MNNLKNFFYLFGLSAKTCHKLLPALGQISIVVKRLDYIFAGLSLRLAKRRKLKLKHQMLY